MTMGKLPSRYAAVAVACLTLGLFLKEISPCFRDTSGWNQRGFVHGPHHGHGQPGFVHGPHHRHGHHGSVHGPHHGHGHHGFAHGSHHGWNQPGFGTNSAKLTQGGRNAPPSYTSFPGVGAYKFHAYGVSWDEALRVCTQEGAKMLIVNSPAEAEVIKGLFKLGPNRHSPGAINSNHVWVGVQEKGTHGQFLTNGGQRLENTGYLVWSNSPPQPNDPGANDCVSFYSSGTLYDDACNIKYPFVCEF